VNGKSTGKSIRVQLQLSHIATADELKDLEQKEAHRSFVNYMILASLSASVCVSCA